MALADDAAAPAARLGRGGEVGGAVGRTVPILVESILGEPVSILVIGRPLSALDGLMCILTVAGSVSRAEQRLIEQVQ